MALLIVTCISFMGRLLLKAILQQNLAALQQKLDQLERLRSENTHHLPMITHTIDSYQITKKFGKNASRIVDLFSRWEPKN